MDLDGIGARWSRGSGIDLRFEDKETEELLGFSHYLYHSHHRFSLSPPLHPPRAFRIVFLGPASNMISKPGIRDVVYKVVR